MNSCRVIASVFETLLSDRSHRSCVAYVAHNLVVRATRHGKPDPRISRLYIMVTLGRPNFAERKFIKLLKKSGEHFPVRKIQIKFFPKKKK